MYIQRGRLVPYFVFVGTTRDLSYYLENGLQLCGEAFAIIWPVSELSTV
jgi:hypothetical protein